MKENDTFGSFKLKTFALQKALLKTVRRQATDREKEFTKDTPDKELLSKIYQELSRLNNRKTKDLLKKWSKELDTSPKMMLRWR